MPVNKLVPEMQELFLKVHNKRISTLGAKEKQKNDITNIKSIKVNVDERCLEVYFKKGDWYKYYPNMTWG